MTYPEKVKSHLWADIHEMSEDRSRFAKNPKTDFTRERKLGFKDLIRFFIIKQSGTTGHELLKYFDYSTDVISNSGFIQQRDKLLPEALRYLLLRFNAHFPFELYKGKYQLIACDGCEFNIARNPDDPDTFHPPPEGRLAVKGHNMIHTTTLFDLLNKRYLDCIVQPSRKKNEFRAICNLADRFPYQGHPVFIADRGFSCYNFYAHAIENRIFFLVRAKDLNVKRYLGVKSLTGYIDQNVELILTRNQSKKERCRPDLEEQYRFISREVAFDYIEHGSPIEYPLLIRIVRVEIAEGIYENLITNLSHDDVSADELKHWYYMRWGIESSFRDLKHTIGTVNFNAKKVDFIVQELWARLILFNFCAIIAMHVIINKKKSKYVYQVNFSMALKICHHFIRLRGREPPPDVVGLIGSFTLPIRPDRSFPRRNRLKNAASFCHRFS
jgi:hypothetical protein